MLGHPITTIELDEDQIDLAISEAEKFVADHEENGHKLIPPYKREQLVREGALCKSQLILARIRLTNLTFGESSKGVKLLQEEAINGHWAWERKVRDSTYVSNKLFVTVLGNILSNPNVDPKQSVDLTWDILRKMYPSIKNEQKTNPHQSTKKRHSNSQKRKKDDV